VERFLLAAAVVVAVAIVALMVERRRPEPPTQARWAVPVQLDRADFPSADTPWLVAVFTSATCDSCAQALAKARVLASDAVAVQDVEIGAQADLHRRYHVEAVPTIVVADEEGVVRASFVGPPTATDLWAAVAEARSPGSSPEPDLGRPAWPERHDRPETS
jgi:protein-disulfide isomerase